LGDAFAGAVSGAGSVEFEPSAVLNEIAKFPKGQIAKFGGVRVGSGRLRPELVQRADDFSHRVFDAAEVIQKAHRPRRIVDQMIGSGTSVGANTMEADEGLSRADFNKSIGIVIKELVETRYWLSFAARREWIKPKRLEPLINEANELKLIYGSILTKSRRNKDS
jgi:four helix bundle protein